MTYQTPELLVVGAAQNLVLGSLDEKIPSENINDDGPIGGYENNGLTDSLGW